jgi:IclR family mhp operon transcriptional activator
MAERDEIKSLKKALAAIAFMNEHGDVTVTQVAKGIGVPRATAYRVLQTLASEGYVDKLPSSDIYRLTSLVRRLAAGFQDEDLLIEIARPMLAQAQQELGWSIALATPRGTEMVVRLNTDHASPLALIRYSVGASLPMLISTCGYCYLAHCRPADREALIESGLANFNPELPVRMERERIDRLISGVLADGFCHLEFDHVREGNLAVPLLLAGRPVGGIVMRYIKSTMRNSDRLREAYAPRLQQLAQEIAQRHPAHLAWQSSIQPVNTPPQDAS